ncbi:MAG: transglutaminase [Bacteroidetes bacterium]|nr:MAG: transglutaminase [Bacteroidota bacterium]
MLSAISLWSSPDIKNLIKNSGNQKEYPGKNTLVIFDSTQVDVRPSGLSYVNIHKLIKILSLKGVKSNAVVKFGYDPLSAYVEIKQVVIYRKSGKIEKLDMSKVLDYAAPARMIYWGASEKMIEVGRLEPGDAIEVFLFRKGFTYALLTDEGDDSKYIPPMKGQYYDIVEFWSSRPVLEKVYQVSVPKDKFMQYKVYNGEVMSSIIPNGDKWLYTFTKKDYSQPKREPRMVASSDEFTKLLMSTSPDWEAKSLWFYSVNEDYGSFETTPAIDAKVDEILKAAKNEMDSVSLLTHWVADNIRYSGISMGCGEGYTLHKGEMTFSDRCGVCKDKAGMLITMLRAAGFESYAAMTMAGSRIDDIPADQFNHSVTVVKLADGKYHILDPTWVPFVRELWSSLEQQQNYLMGVPEGAGLMITPISKPNNHNFMVSGKSKLNVDGSLEGQLIIDAEGQSDAAIRRIFTNNYREEWKSALEKELKSIHPRAVITNQDYGKPMDYQSAPFHAIITYRIPDYAIVTDDEIILTPMAVSGIFKRAMSHLSFNTKLEERKYNFRDRCSRQVMLNETVELPYNTEIAYQPELSMSSGSGASSKGGYLLDGKKLTVSEILKFKKRIYRPEDWGSFREAVKMQQAIMNEPIILSISKD